ncbi:MAG: gliding motility-associated C-terminal domain-containing protein [Flavobacteriales bacterium]|nr:gliding motility-associated C-terminal domain-containing protein [Flavobacteriales bacterium]
MKKYFVYIFFHLVVQEICLAQIEDGLLIHYNLNADCLDYSTNGYDGTPVDVTFIEDQNANPLSAISLNGNTSMVLFPNIPELEIDFPISFMVKARFDEISGEQIIFATDYSETTHSGAWMQLSSQGNLVVSFGNGNGGFNAAARHGKSADFPIEVDVWYCFATVIRGYQDIDIYIDGVLMDGFYTGNATTIAYSSGPGNLGRKCGNPISLIPPYFFDGAIDDFCYWEREITEDEVAGVCESEAPCAGTLTVPDVSGCVNQPITLSFDLEGDISDDADFLWEFEDGSSYTSEEVTIFAPAAGTQEYTLTLTTQDGCVYSASGSISVVNQLQTPDIETEVILCDGEEFTIDTSLYPEWEVSDENGDLIDVFTTNQVGNYIFDFNSACSQEQLEIEITVINPPQLFDLTDRSICEGESIVFDVESWDSIENDSEFYVTVGADLPVQYTGSPLDFDFPVSGQFEVVIEGAIMSCNLDESFQVNVSVAPTSFVDNAYDICQGEVIELDFSSLNFDVVNGDGEAILEAQIFAGGTYVFIGQSGCANLEEVVVVTETEFSPGSFGNFQMLCEGTDTVDIGFNSSEYNYEWESGANSSFISVAESGTYSVIVSDPTGTCIQDFNFQVNSMPFAPAEVFTFPAVDLCSEGQRTINFPPQYGPYTFSDTLHGLAYTAKEPEVLIFSFSDGCYTYFDTLFIDIESCLCPVWVPNVFTPDGDGLNDNFKPVIDCDVSNYTMTIFNRWGTEVFRTNDPNEPWRAESPNTKYFASENVYVYIITYEQKVDGLAIPNELIGNLTLIR